MQTNENDISVREIFQSISEKNIRGGSYERNTNWWLSIIWNRIKFFDISSRECQEFEILKLWHTKVNEPRVSQMKNSWIFDDWSRMKKKCKLPAFIYYITTLTLCKIIKSTLLSEYHWPPFSSKKICPLGDGLQTRRAFPANESSSRSRHVFYEFLHRFSD